MNDMEKKLTQLKQEYDSIQIPEHGREHLRNKINEVNTMNDNKNNSVLRRVAGIAAALALLIALPNTNASLAAALGDLPVVGGFFQVVTLRSYQYDGDNASASIETPEIKTEGESEAAKQVNESVTEYVDAVTDDFKAQLAEYGDAANTDVTVEYEVVTDTEDWLTLRLYTEWVEASGAQFYKYYNIDKANDKVVQLSDLFQENSDALTLISENIKTQMREQMAANENVSYFIDSDMPEEDFQQGKDDQNYRFDEDGNLIITFDEYEVAPGSMGAVEFTVERSVFESQLK